MLHTNKTRLKALLPLFLLIALGGIWGSGYTLARFATTHGVNPLGYAFWQSLGPACFLFGYLKIKRLPLAYSWQQWRFYGICGLLGIAFPNTNMYFAAPHLPSGLLAVIVNTAPLITYLLAFINRLERFFYLRCLAVLLGLAGMLCLVLPQTSLPSSQMTPWILLALLTPLGFGSCAIYIARQSALQNHALSAATGMLLCSTFLLFPLIVYTKSFYPLQLPFTPQAWAIIVEIVLSSLGYLLMFLLLRLAGPVYYSQVNGIVALTGLIWGWVFFRETLNGWNLVAIALILTALVLINWRISLQNNQDAA